LREAQRPERDGLNAGIRAEVKDRLSKLKLGSRAARRAKKKELDREVGAAKRRERETLRAQARDLYDLLKFYRKHRARIQALPAGQRPAAVKALIKAYCSSDPSALAALEGKAAGYAAKRRAEIDIKRRRQYVDMIAKESGVKRAGRRPYGRMQFPKSAADPIKACDDVYAEAKERWAAWETMCAASPELREMKPKEAADIALADTKLLRSDDEMWHSRKAAVVIADYEHNKHED
jgi:hypothetical protein